MIRPLSRWGLVTAGAYASVAAVAAALALQRLLVSTEMPGLAAWELLVLALPWVLALETPLGRQAGGFALAAIVLGGVLLNAGCLYVMASALERRRAHSLCD